MCLQAPPRSVFLRGAGCLGIGPVRPGIVLYLFCLCLKQDPYPRPHPWAVTFPGKGQVRALVQLLLDPVQILLSPGALQLQASYLIGTLPK